MTAGRIAWSRYEGNDVEAVIAMMLNREHPDSVRITPSRGDGGVDILDKGASGDGGDVVNQVKRYSEPLTTAQKSSVEGSFKRIFDSVERDSRWERLNVTEWRLVTPWDPTPEAYNWLQDLPAPNGVKIVWDGLTMVEQLVAKYPDVVDYYLFDGKSAVQDAYREAMTLMSLDGTSEGRPSVEQVTARVDTALRMLDKDPHYLYESRFGQGDPAPPGPRPGLVISSYYIDPAARSWRAVDVIARCAASVVERPITIDGVLTADEGSAFAAEVNEFREFGTPFTSPAGAYVGKIDAPGGLGGELVNATIKTLPVANDLGDNVELTLQALDPEGQVVAEADVDRVERSTGDAGPRVVLREVNGVFELATRFNLQAQTTSFSFTLSPIEGKPVAAILPGVELLSAFHHPNRFGLRRRHAGGGSGAGTEIPRSETDKVVAPLKSLRQVLSVLSRLQEHSRGVIKVPDFDAYAESQLRDWRFVDAILRGEEVTVTVPEEHALDLVADPGTPVPQGSFAVVLPLKTKIGEATYEFGQVLAHLSDPTLVSRGETAAGEHFIRLTTADRSIRYVRHEDVAE